VIVLFWVPLLLAAGAAVAFWVAAPAGTGNRLHRAATRWFSRFVYAAAATAATLAAVRLGAPSAGSATSADPALAATRHLLWLLLYLLVVIVAAVQHESAAIAAAGRPPRVRSGLHLMLNLTAVAGTVALFAASIVWHAWPFVLVVPAGFVVGVRNMQYASRVTATRRERELEGLTSFITAGIGLHTTLFVLAAARWPDSAGSGFWRIVPWVGPTVLGLPVIAWLRRRRR
jgi:hypothetical protein